MNNLTTLKTEGDGALHLAGSLDVYGAESLRQALTEHLASVPDPVVDLVAVEACDTAGAQLLLSVRQTAAQVGKTVRFEHVSPAVADCFACLGLPADLLTRPSA